MRAALKAWHDHSNTSVILVLVSTDFFSFIVIVLILGTIHDFQWKRGQFVYYISGTF